MTKIHHSMGFPITVKQEEMARVLGYEDNVLPDRVLAILNGIEKTMHCSVTGSRRWASNIFLPQNTGCPC